MVVTAVVVVVGLLVVKVIVSIAAHTFVVVVEVAVVR